MSDLAKLRLCDDLKDLASLLGVKASALSYVLYFVPPASKYVDFTIPKASGGNRKISSPEPRLKLIQTRLAGLLTNIWQEMEPPGVKIPIAHGFLRRRSIITNARPHVGRRFIFNVDLLNFFGAIHFGRVRGYFISNKRFQLKPAVATVIAQITCNGSLPQGAPTSPIVSNLVASILDIRLLKLSRALKLRYTRYADDITFSTNAKSFPIAIADTNASGEWVIGKKLAQVLVASSFQPNPQKTRMQFRGSRQTVTGLVVNKALNVPAPYYRHVRSMCNELFQRGTYFRNYPDGSKVTSRSAVVLSGMIGHMRLIESSRPASLSPPTHTNRKQGKSRLEERLAFFSQFLVRKEPFIICEGVSDYIYLRCALRSLAPKYPDLITQTSLGTYRYHLSLLRYSSRTAAVLGLTGGTSRLAALAARYSKECEYFKAASFEHPVIFVVDNDFGLEPLIKSKAFPELSSSSTNPWYQGPKNLLLVKTIESASGKGHSYIEQCFDPSVLGIELDGTKFNPNKEHDEPGEYGKHHFARHVVVPKSGTIDFSGFEPLLHRLSEAIAAYARGGVV